MPEISSFHGLSIYMYFRGAEHNPPHIHVIYQGTEAIYSVREPCRLRGALPTRLDGMVVDWAEQHQEELLDMWEHQRFHRIEPLNETRG